MKKILLLVILLMSTIIFQSYAADDIVQISPDTYMIAKKDWGGIFGDAAKMKTKVIRKANEFAESQGKIAIVVSIKEIPMTPCVRCASIEYQFRVVDKNDPEAQRTLLSSRTDISSKDVSKEHPDLHTELMKLDDLRKKGLLTDKEFETQKQKLLNR